jgi:hypothetical protein
MCAASLPAAHARWYGPAQETLLKNSRMSARLVCRASWGVFGITCLLSGGCAKGGAASEPVAGTDLGASVDKAPPPDMSAANDLAGSAPAAFTSQNGGAFVYGRHYPNGAAAVAYAYGPEGMWKEMNPLEYKWNYYCGGMPGCVLAAAPPANHSTDKNALIAYAAGTHFTTALDANAHLLWDMNHDGEIDTSTGGFAFDEHNGKGAGGVAKGNTRLRSSGMTTIGSLAT